MKKRALLGIVAGFVFLLSSAYADGHEGRGMAMCSMGKGCGHRTSDRQETLCPVTGKFFKKADFLLENSAELSLADDQVKTIEELLLQVKKQHVRQMADMQVMVLDVKAKLKEDKIDVEGINGLVDQGAASMASGTKSVVEAYAKLKGVLTPEQLAKAKEIWMGKKK